MNWKGLEESRHGLIRRYPGILLDGLSKPTKYLSQDSWCSGRVSNQALLGRHTVVSRPRCRNSEEKSYFHALKTPDLDPKLISYCCMGRSIFWDITPYGLVKPNRHYAETHRLHLQGSRARRIRNQLCMLPASWWFLVWLVLRPWKWGDIILRNFNWLSRDRKTLYPRRQLFTATAVKISNPSVTQRFLYPI
jgi:hypothetical protein